MALLKEIWIPTIVEKLFADNSFASRSVNHNAFTDGKTVHVPNAGALPQITVNNTDYPVVHSERVDQDIEYSLDKYEIGPVRVGNIEDVQLSYDKRNSVLQGVRNAITEKIHTDVLAKWVAGAVAATQKTVAAKFTKDTVLTIKTAFDEKDLPMEGRCIILTPAAYNGLVKDLSDAEQFAFSASMDSSKGIIGKLFGFDFYQRSVIDTAAGNKTTAFAWHADCVSTAFGNIDIIEEISSTLFFSDLIAATILAGGAPIRKDGAGIFKVTSA